jgi:hypothetical protein
MVGILLNNLDDLPDHSLLSRARSGGINASNIAITPYFHLAILSNMKHVLLHLESIEMLE